MTQNSNQERYSPSDSQKKQWIENAKNEFRACFQNDTQLAIAIAERESIKINLLTTFTYQYQQTHRVNIHTLLREIDLKYDYQFIDKQLSLQPIAQPVLVSHHNYQLNAKDIGETGRRLWGDLIACGFNTTEIATMRVSDIIRYNSVAKVALMRCGYLEGYKPYFQQAEKELGTDHDIYGNIQKNRQTCAQELHRSLKAEIQHQRLIDLSTRFYQLLAHSQVSILINSDQTYHAKYMELREKKEEELSTDELNARIELYQDLLLVIAKNHHQQLKSQLQEADCNDPILIQQRDQLLNLHHDHSSSKLIDYETMNLQMENMLDLLVGGSNYHRHFQKLQERINRLGKQAIERESAKALMTLIQTIHDERLTTQSLEDLSNILEAMCDALEAKNKDQVKSCLMPYHNRQSMPKDYLSSLQTFQKQTELAKDDMERNYSQTSEALEKAIKGKLDKHLGRLSDAVEHLHASLANAEDILNLTRIMEKMIELIKNPTQELAITCEILSQKFEKSLDPNLKIFHQVLDDLLNKEPLKEIQTQVEHDYQKTLHQVNDTLMYSKDLDPNLRHLGQRVRNDIVRERKEILTQNKPCYKHILLLQTLNDVLSHPEQARTQSNCLSIGRALHGINFKLSRYFIKLAILATIITLATTTLLTLYGPSVNFNLNIPWVSNWAGNINGREITSTIEFVLTAVISMLVSTLAYRQKKSDFSVNKRDLTFEAKKNLEQEMTSQKSLITNNSLADVMNIRNVETVVENILQGNKADTINEKEKLEKLQEKFQK